MQPLTAHPEGASPVALAAAAEAEDVDEDAVMDAEVVVDLIDEVMVVYVTGTVELAAAEVAIEVELAAVDEAIEVELAASEVATVALADLVELAITVEFAAVEATVVEFAIAVDETVAFLPVVEATTVVAFEVTAEEVTVLLAETVVAIVVLSKAKMLSKLPPPQAESSSPAHELAHLLSAVLTLPAPNVLPQ